MNNSDNDNDNDNGADHLSASAEPGPIKKELGYVYLMQAASGEYKLGKSKSVSWRQKRSAISGQRQRGLKVIKSNHYSRAEQDLQLRFISKRVAGSQHWYKLDEADLKSIMSIETMDY